MIDRKVLGKTNLQECKSILPTRIIDKVSRMKNKNDVMNTVIGEMLVAYGLKQTFGFTPDMSKIVLSSFGKPYYVPNSKICFNVSHSNTLIAVAVSTSPVGIDVEQKKFIDPCVLGSLSVSEKNYLKTCSCFNDELVRIWTIRESYVKMLGIGLFKDLDTFEYDPISLKIIDKTTKTIFLNISSFYLDNYIISVSEKYRSKVKSPLLINPSELINNYTEVR